ncbi:hypothetical protein R5R35_013001 [Gryllus longicercus]|uniref:Fatty acid binding protein n=1 Tax=Gryllus longicercus TaxID=2509291 RepID=A0AAN9V452_9ORTH
MVQIEGKYQHEKNENLDAYFRAVGVPYIGRKMMQMSSPLLEVNCEDGKWTFKTITMLRTHEVSFILGEEYNEVMPSGDALKCKTIKDGDSLVTETETPSGSKVTRTYTFSEDGVLLTMVHEESGEIAKRHFKRM